jgi:hypothetical protein
LTAFKDKMLKKVAGYKRDGKYVCNESTHNCTSSKTIHVINLRRIKSDRLWDSLSDLGVDGRLMISEH